MFENAVKCYTLFNSRADKFDRLEHVFIVGTGGAVPHFTDFDRHVRLGDVVVSAPRSPGGPLYLHCQASIFIAF